MDKNENIKNARNELKQVSGDYELRRIAELNEKYIRDEAAALEFALEKGQKEGIERGLKEGRERGFKQGIEQEKLRVAKEMLEIKMDKQVISQITGLSIDKINNIV